MLLGLIKATRVSLQGLVAIWRYQRAFQLEFVFLIILIPVAFYINVSKVERLMLIGSVGFVLIVEVINSAIETIIDRIGKEQHVLSGQAKDMGSAAVFLALLLTVFTWWSILWKK